jgi:hypothetical protein
MILTFLDGLGKRWVDVLGLIGYKRFMADGFLAAEHTDFNGNGFVHRLTQIFTDDLTANGEKIIARKRRERRCLVNGER